MRTFAYLMMAGDDDALLRCVSIRKLLLEPDKLM